MYLSSSLGDCGLVVEVVGLTASYGLPPGMSGSLEDLNPQIEDTSFPPLAITRVSRVPGRAALS